MGERDNTELSADAYKLYLVFGDLLTDDWRDVNSFAPHVAVLGRWLPVGDWRPLWHELGYHQIVAHSVRAGVVCISRWRNRFDPRSVQNDTLRLAIAQHYTDWSPFCWDSFNDVLLAASIQTEALWQLNHVFCGLINNLVIESRNNGKEVRCTQENLKWILNKVTM